MKEIIINDIIFRICVNHYKDIAVSECGILYSISKQSIIEPSNWNKTKYHTTSSRHTNGRILPVPFHRAVALYWVDNPLNKTHVNHINHNKHDNRACNLEWCTHEENMNAYKFHRESIKCLKSEK